MPERVAWSQHVNHAAAVGNRRATGPDYINVFQPGFT